MNKQDHVRSSWFPRNLSTQEITSSQMMRIAMVVVDRIGTLGAPEAQALDNLLILRKFSRWQAAGDMAREAAALIVLGIIGPRYTYSGLVRYAGSETPIATFQHDQGIELVLIPGGTAELGVSPRNRRALAAIDPNVWLPNTTLPLAESVQIEPFLMARKPLDMQTLAPLVRSFASDFYQFLHRARDRKIIDFRRFDPNDVLPLTPNQAFMARIRPEMALPTERQWEYAYRCGAKSLFPWGDELPADRTHWDRMLLTNLSEEAAVERSANAFGLVAMQSGEFCADPFEPSFAEGNHCEHIHDEQMPTMRGGAARFAPWRDLSWTMCISGSRWDPQYNPEDRCAVRLVENFPTRPATKRRRRPRRRV